VGTVKIKTYRAKSTQKAREAQKITNQKKVNSKNHNAAERFEEVVVRP
jgi:hypothetical protein